MTKHYSSNTHVKIDQTKSSMNQTHPKWKEYIKASKTKSFDDREKWRKLLQTTIIFQSPNLTKDCIASGERNIVCGNVKVVYRARTSDLPSQWYTTGACSLWRPVQFSRKLLTWTALTNRPGWKYTTLPRRCVRGSALMLEYSSILEFARVRHEKS